MIRNKYLPNNFKPIASPELSYVLGVLKGDGTVYKTKRSYKYRTDYYSYQICLSVRDKCFADNFADNLSKLFRRRVKVIKCDEKQNRGIFYKVFLASKEFYDWYNSSNILKIGLKYPSEFIKGVYDSEGSFGYICSKVKNKSYCYATIRFISSDKELLLSIQKVLNKKFNISSKFRDRGVPRPSILRDRRVTWKKKVYRLGIFNKKGVTSFFREIGSSVSYKKPTIV